MICLSGLLLIMEIDYLLNVVRSVVESGSRIERACGCLGYRNGDDGWIRPRKAAPLHLNAILNVATRNVRSRDCQVAAGVTPRYRDSTLPGGMTCERAIQPGPGRRAT